MRNARKRVPTPELIGSRGQQLRFLIGRMDELVAAFARLTLLFEQTVHGAGGAAVHPFVQQRAINFSGRAVLKALGMQMAQHDRAFLSTEGSRR
jgi:hypothetical protein